MKWILVVTVFVSSAIAKERCAKSLVRTYVDGQPRVETTRLCLDDETRPGAPPDPGFLISESCLKNAYCQAMVATSELQQLRDVSTRDRYGRRFHWCKTQGGKPEVIEYQWDGRFQPSDRCVFPDHSFVDTMSLLGIGRFKPEEKVTLRRGMYRKAPANGGGGRGRKH